MPSDKSLEKLKTLQDTIQKAIANKEFSTAFQTALKELIEYVKGAKTVITTQQREDFARLEASLTKAWRDFQDDQVNGNTDQFEGMKKNLDELMSSVRFSHEAMIAEAQAKIDTVRDGIDGKDGKDGADGLDGKDGSPDTPEEVRDKLETLQGEERLDASAIKNLPSLIEKESAPFRGGIRGVEVFDEGITKGSFKFLNFTGAGVTVTRVGEYAVISISGGGPGSSTPSQESGTITNLTDIVTLAQTPIANTLLLYINEAFVDPSRYSLTGAGKTITMGSALDGSYSGLRYTAIYQY